MATILDRNKVRDCLERFDLQSLFIEELGWDHGGADAEAAVAGQKFTLKAIAHKRGMVAYRYIAESEEVFPDYPTRQKIEKAVTKSVREHIIVYAPPNRMAQYWQWVKREPGRPDRSRFHIYHRGKTGESLIQRLEHLVFTLDEEDDLTIVDVSGRVRAAFDVERVTKKFYDRFKTEHDTFLGFIDGIEGLADREWYASLMLNRMMFIYFIQKRGFLDGNPDYLRHRLEWMQREQGSDQFLRFYRLFLLRLFHEGLGQPEADRSPELAALLGQVPYLNGGLFDVHDLERDNREIHIPDEAFQRIFSFFDAYQWHLDDRPLHDDNEINPDVLGYIFEKYINQKQMGAYYTKEDITGYISRNTIIPFLFDQAKKECPIAFEPDGGVWRLLQDNPDRYFHDSVRHGITYDIHRKVELENKQDLPPEIVAGVIDVARRDGWNSPAPTDYALPTETWREHVARRQRHDEVSEQLAAGKVDSINDLISYNLDIEKFAQDIIAQSEGPELVRAFWKAINAVSILDPTCGSGAFLFAALNTLEPLYVTCLEAMRGSLDDLERSGRKHHPETMNDFRNVLERVAVHASERYFVLKSIVVGNLYGVDIMEEAVEICKLRLFLKLIAQLDGYDQIEPLPDIDFNIRPGNTLVGFASLEEVRSALGADMVKQLALPDIEERTEIADGAFRTFQQMQTEHEVDTVAVSTAKLELRARLNELRTDLNRYLANEYGIKADSEDAYADWQERHQPFHWFVEFYGIMHSGGFDVIIGNPPYVTYPSMSVPYSVAEHSYKTLSTKNLYGLVFERSITLAKSPAPVGLIVQLTSLSAEKLSTLQEILQSRGLWYAMSFPRRPQSIFEGVEMPVSILISIPTLQAHLFTTNICRFYAEEKASAIDTASFCRHSVVIHGHRVAKFGSYIDNRIFEKIAAFDSAIGNLASKTGKAALFYQEACRYWAKATNRRPFFKKNGQHVSPSHWRTIPMRSDDAAAFCTCILNSSLFYWFYSTFSDCEHINDSLVRRFPIPKSWDTEGRDWGNMCTQVIDNLESNSKRKKINTKQGHVVEYDEISGAGSKEHIDTIDMAMAETYGLDAEELDYLSHYDIKYRLGRDGAAIGIPP